MPAVPLAIAWIFAVLLTPADGRRAWVRLVALAGQAATLAALIALAARLAAVETVTGGWPAGIGIRLRADALSYTFAIAASAVLMLVFVYEHARGVSNRAVPALFAFLVVGLLGAFLTADLFNFYVFFEITVTAAVALASYGRGPPELRAAYTFLTVNLVGSVIFLAAIATAYRASGTLDMHGIADALRQSPSPIRLLVATLLFAAFGLKLGLFPFHAWVPPVYRGTEASVAATLAVAVAMLGAYGLLRLLVGVIPEAVEAARGVLFVLGGTSALYAGVLAYSCRQPTEALAYSSVAQAGFVLAALALPSTAALSAAIVFTVVNSINKAMLFLGTEACGRFMSAAYAIGALSVAGLPPTAGFWAKLGVVRAAIVDREYALAAVLIAASALSITYMMPVFQRRFWRERPRGQTAGLGRLVIILLALVLLAIGLWPAPLWSVAEAAASTLTRGAL